MPGWYKRRGTTTSPAERTTAGNYGQSSCSRHGSKNSSRTPATRLVQAPILSSPERFTYKKQSMLARKKILFVDNDVRTFISHRLALAKSGTLAGLEVHLAAPPS